MGLAFPMCECGIVVVMRRLLRKGLPLACCIAYMLAGPIINVVVILSTWVAFEGHKIAPEVVGMRVGLGFLVASITGFVVHMQARKRGTAALLTSTALPPPAPLKKTTISLKTLDAANGVAEDPEDMEAAAPRRSIMERLGNISSTAIHDFVDITVFLIIGAVLAALSKQLISSQQIERLSADEPLLAIPAMMLLAVLMCLCSEADAFVAASFTKMHISAKMAFLVLGPMLDLKLLAMYTRVFRLRLIITITTCVVLQVLAYTLIVHLIYHTNGWAGRPV
jgi:uncharacterized membrane protein YraQ (UPF0718 family)